MEIGLPLLLTNWAAN